MEQPTRSRATDQQAAARRILTVLHRHIPTELRPAIPYGTTPDTLAETAKAVRRAALCSPFLFAPDQMAQIEGLRTVRDLAQWALGCTTAIEAYDRSWLKIGPAARQRSFAGTSHWTTRARRHGQPDPEWLWAQQAAIFDHVSQERGRIAAAWAAADAQQGLGSFDSGAKAVQQPIELAIRSMVKVGANDEPRSQRRSKAGAAMAELRQRLTQDIEYYRTYSDQLVDEAWSQLPASFDHPRLTLARTIENATEALRDAWISTFHDPDATKDIDNFWRLFINGTQDRPDAPCPAKPISSSNGFSATSPAEDAQPAVGLIEAITEAALPRARYRAISTCTTGLSAV